MSISEIKALLSGDTVSENVLKELMNDPRKGVQQLVASYIKRMNRESAERLRVEDMYEPESSFYKKGMTLVAGIDEVGRGPLAGPVTVAAVILKPHTFFAGINDSKKVSPKKREELAEEIHKKALAVSIEYLSGNNGGNVQGGKPSENGAGSGDCRCHASSFRYSVFISGTRRCPVCLCSGGIYRSQGVQGPFNGRV